MKERHDGRLFERRTSRTSVGSEQLVEGEIGPLVLRFVDDLREKRQVAFELVLIVEETVIVTVGRAVVAAESHAVVVACVLRRRTSGTDGRGTAGLRRSCAACSCPAGRRCCGSRCC